MSYNFRPYAQDQMYLMPPSITEWVSEASLARFTSEVLDEMDREGKLAAVYHQYREDGWGSAAYHPVMMVKILVYGYCMGITSSRRMAQALESDIAFRYLSAAQQPDFRTIADFRRLHLHALAELFVHVLALCREAGLVKLGRVALDGRRVAANAALDQNRTVKSLEEAVQHLLDEAERLDRAEDRCYGAARGDELPAGLRTQAGRLQRLQEAKRRLEHTQGQAMQAQVTKIEARRQQEAETGQKRRGRKPRLPDEVRDRDAKVNLTDLDSRILKSRHGWIQGYNGQAMADCDSQVIVACELVAQENDVRQLGPMLERCETQTGAQPTQLVADAGYWSEENATLQNADTELFIATLKDWKQRKALRDQGAPKGRIPHGATIRDRMERKLLTRRGKAIYKQRGRTIEPVFGQMSMRGLNRFWLRGLQKVKAEWSLWCTTHNLLKLWRSGFWPARVKACAMAY